MVRERGGDDSTGELGGRDRRRRTVRRHPRSQRAPARGDVRVARGEEGVRWSCDGALHDGGRVHRAASGRPPRRRGHGRDQGRRPGRARRTTPARRPRRLSLLTRRVDELPARSRVPARLGTAAPLETRDCVPGSVTRRQIPWAGDRSDHLFRVGGRGDGARRDDRGLRASTWGTDVDLPRRPQRQASASCGIRSWASTPCAAGDAQMISPESAPSCPCRSLRRRGPIARRPAHPVLLVFR